MIRETLCKGGRTEVISHLPKEEACLGQVHATLTSVSWSWRGVRMTPEIEGQLAA